ncbi:MAG: hypothetical protein GC178_01250 [Flavobacteriales bacterium]|nr:hypothetical protein [Flavobacteriales bacterium]
MDQFKEFFRKNDVKIGEGKDFVRIPPIHYSSLHNAVRSYYESFRTNQSMMPYISDIHTWSREAHAFNFKSTDEIVQSILGFHRFIELLLKDILRRVNPFLVVRLDQHPKDVFAFLDQTADPDTIRTVEFQETLRRFKQAFLHYDSTSEVYQNVLKRYKFILSKENQETISVLTEWRNRIMHNGNTLPNFISFEYLVSQRLFPMLQSLLKAEKDMLKNWRPLYFETHTGLNLLEEILSVRFSFTDFSNETKTKTIIKALLKLGHLKELGRAADNHDFGKRNGISYYEPQSGNPNIRTERFVESETQLPDFFSRHNCICCGAKTLIVYRSIVELPDPTKAIPISWLKCYNCDYSISRGHVGDPFDFGLSEKRLFPDY